MKKIKIDEELVEHVGDLARLKISASEISEYQKNFKEIIEYIEQLNEIDTQGVEPLYNPLTENLNFYTSNIKSARKEREDEPKKSLPVPEVLKNSPSQKNNQFKIKAVIEDQ